MKIDKINNKIIVELLNNCRISNIRLGKKVGLSREGISNRIKKLEKSEVISGYGIDVDFSKLGFMPHEVSIKLQNINSDKENKIIKSFRSNNKIIFVEKVLGKFDYIIMILVKSLAELDLEIEILRKELEGHLKEININAWIANYDTTSSYFTENSNERVSRHVEDEKTHHLSLIDKNLLKELALNSRSSAVNLARKLNVSEITIANRIRVLLKNKIIKNIRATIDFEKLGLSKYVIFLNISGVQSEIKLSEFCKNHKLISDFTKFIGQYNYSIEIIAKNNREFKKVVEELLNNFSNIIINYETAILLEEIKHVSFR